MRSRIQDAQRLYLGARENVLRLRRQQDARSPSPAPQERTTAPTRGLAIMEELEQLHAAKESEIRTLIEKSARDQQLRQEADRARELRKQIEEQTRAAQKALEVYSQDFPKGVESLQAILRDHAQGPFIQPLAGLTKGILAHPDDEKLRTVRLSNPKFHEAIGQFQGAREALFAIGFRVVHRAVAADDANLEPFLVLPEPDPLTAFEEWATWFGVLRECSDALSTHAS